MKAIYLDEVFGLDSSSFNQQPATLTLETDPQEETGTLRIHHDGDVVMDVPLDKDDLRALADLIPSEYEFKNMREARAES